MAIDLYCGLGGWTEGLLAEGWRVIGFDIEAHDYGTGRYPGQLVLQDVLKLHGSQFKSASLIVASPPCQAYSYRAMPWSRAKALPPPDNALFDACFRIQQQANYANGVDCPSCGGIGKMGHFKDCSQCHGQGWVMTRYIPLIVENVRGAVKWVSQPCKWHFGSYYLWGDVPALMPMTLKVQKFNPDGTEHGPGSWFAIADSKQRGAKTVGHANKRDGHTHARHLTNQRESEGVKFSQSGDAWFDGKPRDKMLGDKGPAAYGSKSNSRKAASAHIAKIPIPLAQHIARVFLPEHVRGVA